MKGTFRKLALLAATIASTAFLLSGCSDGKDGAAGANGTNGTNGINGTNGLDRSIAVVDSGKLTTTDLKNNALAGNILSIDMTGNKPVVKFQVYMKANGQGIVGLRTFSLHIAQLKPVVNSSNSYWQNYIAAGLPQTAMPARATAVVNPSADSVSTFKADGTIDKQGYAIVDNLDGTYTATFGADIKANTNVPYDGALVHRVAIGVRSVAVPGVVGKTPGAYAGPINPETGAVMGSFLNTNGTALVYDFVPATGKAYTDATGSAFARDIVNIAACNQCHSRLEHGSNNTSGHFGSRPDTKVCVVCHTPQLSAIAAYGEGDFTTFIHKIHMGSRLPATETAPLTKDLGVNNIVLPMDPRNCTICHKGAVVDSWKTNTTRKACGSCHNDVNFATGANHPGIGGARTDDTQCIICHTDSYVSSIHATDYSTPNNRQTPAGLVNFKYDLKSVTVNASKQAVITFRILSDGGTGATPTAVTLNAAGGLTGFTGGPAFILAYNKSATNQTFTTSPDYNNAGAKAAQPITVSIANLADGTKGTLSAPNADGYYTGTVTAAASNFPDGAKMRTVGMQSYFSQTSAPATVAASIGRHTISDVKTVTGDTARRVVIDSGKCGACHEVFEGHGGNRNIGKDTVGEAVCTLCHVPNLSTSGKGIDAKYVTSGNAAYLTAVFADPATAAILTTWGQKIPGFLVADPTTYPEATNNFKDMIHGIHAGSSRTTNPLRFVRDRASSGSIVFFDASTITFPGVLKNCEGCHTSTSYKSLPTDAQVTTDETNAGTVFTLANNVTAVSAARTSLPNAQDLVTTPFTGACVSCHDLTSSVAHMKSNGGQIKVQRSLAIPDNEACATCHGATGTASIYISHRY